MGKVAREAREQFVKGWCERQAKWPNTMAEEQACFDAMQKVSLYSQATKVTDTNVWKLLDEARGVKSFDYGRSKNFVSTAGGYKPVPASQTGMLPELRAQSGYQDCKHLGKEPVKGVEGLYGASFDDGLSMDKDRLFVLLEARLLEKALWVSAPFSTVPDSPFNELKVRRELLRMIYWPWKDQSAPQDIELSAKRCEWLLTQFPVEVACWGGHGRTGSVLAVLAALKKSWPTSKAIENLRAGYCTKAIEAKVQEEWIVRVLSKIRGEPYELRSERHRAPVAVRGKDEETPWQAQVYGGARKAGSNDDYQDHLKHTQVTGTKEFGANFVWSKDKRAYVPRAVAPDSVTTESKIDLDEDEGGGFGV